MNLAWAGLLPLWVVMACTSLQVALPDGTSVNLQSLRFLNETSTSLTSADGTAFVYSSALSAQLAEATALLQQLLQTITPHVAGAASPASCCLPEN